MKKQVKTLEDIAKQLADLQKLVEEQNKKVSTTYIPYIPPVVVVQGHSHCVCHQCHPHPYYQPFTVMCGGSSIGSNNERVLNTYY